MIKDVHREITSLTPEDSFLVFERVKDDFDYPIHFHPEYELNLVVDGKDVRRIIGDHMEPIENYELVLVGPNLPHGWETFKCKQKNILEVTIQFHNDLFETKLLSRRMMKPIKEMFDRSVQGILFSQETTKELTPLIRELSKTDNIEHFLDFVSLLQKLAVSPNQRLLSSLSSQKQDFENSDKIKTIYEYVQANYQNKISLNEISAQVNMSPVSFNRFIKKRTGKTFIEFVNSTRIGYATRLLIEEDISIAEIAFKCGFNNIANFNRVFKKSKNYTPSQYREEFSGLKRIL